MMSYVLILRPRYSCGPNLNIASHVQHLIIDTPEVYG